MFMSLMVMRACVFFYPVPYSSYRPSVQWDPKYRIKVRVICARAYHALFMVRHGPPVTFHVVPDMS